VHKYCEHFINIIAHGCKNFKKKLETIGKKYKEFNKMAARGSKAMRKLIIDSQGNEEIFLKKMDIKLDHYCGDHIKCSEPHSAACQNLKRIENPIAKKEFMV
jgi:hypothetical protein